MDNGQTYFATIAENYDRLQPIVVGPSYNAGLGMIIDLIPYDTTHAFQFIELGCGTAELTDRILSRFQKATGTAVDNEPEMLKIAKIKLGQYPNRGRTVLDSMINFNIPECHIIVSSKAFHHVAPQDMPILLRKIAGALSSNGYFILFDHMSLGPRFGDHIRLLSQRIHSRHIAFAIEDGKTVQKEIDDRQVLKKEMKSAGKDVEYWHNANNILNTMTDVGFSETGIVWQMFADIILVGFKS